MRILLVTQYYWPENFLINVLVPLLVERGVEVTVLTAKPNYPDGFIFKGYRAGGCQQEKHEGITILRLPIAPRGNGSRARLVVNYLSFIFSGILFGSRLVRDFRFDLVFVYAPSPLLQALPAIWLARIRRVPLVLWVQDLWPESLSVTGGIKNKWLLGAVTRIVRLIYRSSDRILVQSQGFVAPVGELTDDPTKIHYYPNLYKVNRTMKPSQRTIALVQELESNFSIVFAGNLGTAQALGTIVEAARQLMDHPEIRIVVVGSGSLGNWLSQQIDLHGLTNLTLAGRFKPEEMSTIFAAAKALLVSLQPQTPFGLTIPSKIQAYLAAGRPVLASLNGEGSTIISEAGAGLCSDAGNAKALAENLLRLVAMSSNQREKMGRNGRSYFDRHFAPDALADKLVEHFESVISKEEKAE